MITLNLLLPLKIKNFNSSEDYPIQIDRNENIIVNKLIYSSVENTIEEINIVLRKIIPNLQLKIEKQREEMLPDGSSNIIADFRSIRDEKPISLRYESEGIKRIVSILGVLIAVYNQSSVCVAIDELDSGIFEYLLGEILEVLSSEIKGQLIFTSHNLRILEKVDKKNIVFSTINPENRYIKFKYVKPNNNLRDMYLREILIQEQSEKLYDETKQSDIKRAFYRAGVNNEKR
ncbi:MAG: AAA family ATPase [Fusobacterium gastrosuis]|uniref:AAA family ATPase n=1 Tax=Fusobacterium gastrosuis TaxID=1755100 RepID=UPI002A853637|nr:AAA family ATPase [Fusobacterium gastrosuis]